MKINNEEYYQIGEASIINMLQMISSGIMKKMNGSNFRILLFLSA
ncbi:hypothetical protein [Dorea sp.]